MKLVRKLYPKVRVKIKKGYPTYEVDCRSKNWEGQKQMYFSTKDEALKKAKEVADLVAEHGKAGVHHEDIKLLARVRRKLVPFHLGLEEAIDLFVQSREKTVALQKSSPVSVVCDEWIESKNNPLKPVRPATIKQVRHTARILSRNFGERAVGTVTKEEIEQLLKDWDITNTTKKIYCKMFKAFFIFSKKKKYVSKNPCDGIEIYTPNTDVRFLTVTDSIKFLGNVLTEPELIPYTTIAMFSGIRPIECERLKWSDINLVTKQIYIHQSVSKVGHDRYVPISDNLVEWLLPYVGKPIKIKNQRNRMNRCRGDIEWQQDILRHTATSYMMGKYKNAGEVSEYLGNSPTIIKKHYQRAVPQAEVELFWSLTPTKVRELIDEQTKATMLKAA